MIVPEAPQSAADVAGHYDELDPVYRAIWGEHVHHGLWRSRPWNSARAIPGVGPPGRQGREAEPDRRHGTMVPWRRRRETPEQAVEALADLVGDRLAPAPGDSLVDIGCGYGATAQRFAETLSVSVTGFTLSLAQHQVAAARPGALAFHVRDWLDNGLPDAAFDHAYAIESSEHMADKPRFFAEAHRVLKPGGRLVVAAWLAAPAPTPWQVRRLLEPICREGRLPSMGSRADYEEMAEAAGFALESYEDLSDRVQRTWTICLGRFLKRLVTDPTTRRLARRARNRAFALALPRLILAYRTGAMRYGLFTLVRG